MTAPAQPAVERHLQLDSTRMFSWSVSRHAERWAGGVTGSRTRAFEDVVDALKGGDGIQGEVQECWLAAGPRYTYGDVIARAQLAPDTGAVVWAER